MDQDKELAHLRTVVARLEREVEFLRRENNRRKSEVQQVASVVRRG